DVPKVDAWKNGYRYESWSDNGGAANRYAVASGGKDRKFEHASLRDYQPRVSSDPAADLVYSNGDFVAYFESAPAGPQIADGSEATFEKATMLYRADRFVEAIPLFEQFVRARPDHALAQARLGLSLSQVERYEESVAVLQRANELDPTDYQSRNNLALVYEKLGRAELGVAPAREAAALQPGEPLVQNTLGLVLMKAGHLPEAIEHLETAARLQPKLVAAHYNLALAYTEAGRHDRAQRALATLRSLDATTASQLEAELREPAPSRGATTAAW
ncbi:MAG TPA: tetratricopeptide repeat protein, partial [Thermoanaerobaculia bacterium]|nr:tetratricopeptide repeat protein [Thermoanaerobaculia bacterium]